MCLFLGIQEAMDTNIGGFILIPLSFDTISTI